MPTDFVFYLYQKKEDVMTMCLECGKRVSLAQELCLRCEVADERAIGEIVMEIENELEFSWEGGEL